MPAGSAPDNVAAPSNDDESGSVHSMESLHVTGHLLVDDPNVQPQDAVVIRFTSPGPSRLLTMSPRGRPLPLPESHPGLPSSNDENPEATEEVDPASIPLPEVDVREILLLHGSPWPEVTLGSWEDLPRGALAGVLRTGDGHRPKV